MNDSNRAKTIFLEAVDKHTPAERSAFLQDACGNDDALRRRIEALLRAHDDPDSVLEKPVYDQLQDSTQPTESVLTDRSSDAHGTAGQRVGPYRILQQIGEGGFGVVFLAEQEEPLRRRVALKIIKPGMDSRQVIARFEAERQALAMMDHQNIARVLDAGATDAGLPYFVMELIKGVPITEYCDHNRLTLAERLRLLIPVCNAIHHAHQKGIIHRDIKPSNVLVCLYDGQPVPKVIDFGVAKAISHSLTEKTLFTQHRQVVGTLEYMSPEQAESNQLDIDTRSDVYSLGVLLYVLLTGSTPITRKELLQSGFVEVLRMIRESEPERPSTRLSHSHETLVQVSQQRRTDPSRLSGLVKGELDWIVMKALEKDRVRRYGTASGLAEDIQRYLDQEPVAACPPSRIYKLRKFAIKHRTAVTIAVSTCLLLLLSTLVSLWQWRSASVSRDRAVKSIEAERRSALIAESMAIEAQEQYSRAERQSQVAVNQATLAEAANQLAQQHLYVAHMNLVGKAIDAGDLQSAIDLLLRYESGTSTSDLRGFEWFYWKNQCDGIRLQSSLETWVGKMAVSPNGRTVATSMITQGVSRLDLWDLNTKQPRPISSAVGAIAFASDSVRLATAALAEEQPLITIRDIVQETTLAQFDPGASVVQIAFSPDNRSLAAATSDGIRLYDPKDGNVHGRLDAAGSAPVCFEFSSDGQSMVIGYADGRVSFWDLEHDQAIATFRAHRDAVSFVRYIPNSSSVLTYSRDGSASLWSIETQQEQLRLSLDKAVTCVAITSDGAWCLAGEQNGIIHVIDLATGSESIRFKADREYLTGISFLGSEQELISGGSSINLWRFDPQPSRVTLNEAAQSLAMSAESDLIACNNCVRSLTQQSRTPLQFHAAVLAADFSPNGDRLLTGTNTGRVDVWNPQTGESEITFEGHQKHVHAVAFSSDGQRIATGSSDATVRVWNLPERSPALILSGHPTPVTSVHFSPDGQLLASANGDRKARLWSVETGSLVAEIAESQAIIQHLRFSPDGRTLATSAGNEISLWNLSTHQSVCTLSGHTDLIWCFEFSPDGATIASAGQDQSMRLWNVKTGDEKARFGFSDSVRNVKFSQDGQRLAVASGTSVTLLIAPKPASNMEFPQPIERLLE